MPEYPRNAKDSIGDPRRLPFIKDLLAVAMKEASSEDVIVWTNDDTILDPSFPKWVLSYVSKHRAVSMRRTENASAEHMRKALNRNLHHIGRDMFAFQVSWLRENWDEFPDYILGASDFDLGIAAMLRNKHGVKSRLGNMGVDFFPADATERLIFHDPHKGAWEVPMFWTLPSNKWNRRQFMNWAAKHQPSLPITMDGLKE